MDRTVYFNPETFSNSNYSGSGDDSYQSTPITSSRASRQNSVNSFATRVKGGSRAALAHKGLTTTGGAYQTSRRPQQPALVSRTRGVSTKQQHFQNNDENWGNEGGGLTRNILQSGISRVAVPCLRDRDEMEYHYGSVLVLHLQCKNLTCITLGALDPFCSLKNLYLYKNNIRRIQGLDRLTNLESLDLSRNNVERIDNLDNCTKLKKLCLGFNEIQVMEGLENLVVLEELYVDDQDMPPEQPLIFAPGTMASISNCLFVLDLSSNQLSTLEPIANMRRLEVLVASDNNLDNLSETLQVLQTLSQLRILNLKGNPISTLPIYKTQIIGTVYRLEELDGKEVNDTTRACLQKLSMMKKYRAQQKAEANELKKNMAKKVEEKSILDIVPGGSILQVGSSEEFSFSTPTRLSPLPPKPPQPKRKQQQPVAKKSQGSTKSTPTPNQSEGEDSPRTDATTSALSSTQEFEMSNIVVDGSLYESRARNSLLNHPDFDVVGGDGDHMSEMAKIIFRLSNLDDGTEGQNGGIVMKHSNYWDPPGSSMPQECRPLSPLEGLDFIMTPRVFCHFTRHIASKNQ
ncbi:Protein phosphatase 1 regulatory subunit 42 [Orchesella cincta]|uniref:Dynein axonemal assembly factor 1 homolog n=1 Tax=Orchesella cincta TaxID=48709 RepID=A0A1D2NDA9_ORCCI|nr:Protein phosphatase 1 regulatory subunit 42 [Orchesella cincta]